VEERSLLSIYCLSCNSLLHFLNKNFKQHCYCNRLVCPTSVATIFMIGRRHRSFSRNIQQESKPLSSFSNFLFTEIPQQTALVARSS
jgi:hypothetical protein